MPSQTLLLLRTTPRHAASAAKAVLTEEDFVPTKDSKDSLALLKKPATQVRLIVISKEAAWVVLGAHGEQLPIPLLTAVAEGAGGDGWLIERQSSRMVLWRIVAGERSEASEKLELKQAQQKLIGEGIAERLINFVVAEHLSAEDTKRGKHEDVLLGFTASMSSKPSEVEQALGSSTPPPKEESVTYTLAEFLQHAVGHERVRVIAQAQIEEQLRRNGFTEPLSIINPQPEGHFCEAFDTESYSFTSNGPYVWFEWSCEEACEPRLPEEKAFPSCDLRFKLEKSADV